MGMIGARGGNSLAAKVAGTDYYQRTGRVGGSCPKPRKSRFELENAMAIKLQQLNALDTTQKALLSSKAGREFRRLLREQIRYYRRKIERCE